MQDEQLTRLKGYISTGFPCDKKNLLTDLHEFWPHKEMLSIKSGLITCGNRIAVPKEMRDTKAKRDVSLGQGTLYFGPRSPMMSSNS